MKRRSIICLVSLLAAAMPAASRAGGYSVAEQSAVAGATGGAATAREGDAGAAWYNPAALADDGGLRLSLGLLVGAPTLTAESMDLSTSAESTGARAAPQLFASYGRGNLAAGVAVVAPFGGEVSWPDDWAGRHEVVSTQLTVVRIAPFVAFRRGRLRVAAGPHLDLAELRLARSLDFVDREGDVALSLRGRGVGVDAAAWWRAVEGQRPLDLGLSWKSRGHIALAGEADFTAPDEFAAVTPDQTATSRLDLPDRIAFGAAWQPGAARLFGDVELTTWQVNRALDIDFANADTPDLHQDSRWHSTVALRLGGEMVRAGTTLRAGAYLDPSPAPSDTLAPSSPDATRLGLSLGAGRDLGHGLRLDGFYGYMHLVGRASDGSESMALRYGGHAHLLGLSLAVQK